jgi:hypothetical protein
MAMEGTGLTTMIFSAPGAPATAGFSELPGFGIFAAGGFVSLASGAVDLGAAAVQSYQTGRLGNVVSAGAAFGVGLLAGKMFGGLPAHGQAIMGANADIGLGLLWPDSPTSSCPVN